jgi:hypothetical protein
MRVAKYKEVRAIRIQMNTGISGETSDYLGWERCGGIDGDPIGELLPRHYDRDFGACQHCVEEHAITCGARGNKFWETDLESTDVAWFDQRRAVLLCEDCLAESEEVEEIYEDFNAGEALRGQLEMALAMV